MDRPLELLLLCDRGPVVANTVADHVNSLARFSKHRVRLLDMAGDLPEALELDRFDSVLIHYSLFVAQDAYLSPRSRARLRQYRGLKAVFAQDEYRWVDDTVAALSAMGVDLLFTVVPEDVADRIYDPAKLPGLRKVTILTGYVPEALLAEAVPPYAERPIDVGYRARRLPAWLGRFALEKSQIADRFLADAPAHGLLCDVSCRESDRIYGKDWIRFVANSKATLGTESGASVCDFTGEIQRAVETAELLRPGLSFEQLSRRYFAAVDGQIEVKVISPRCFEAACLRTLMILYPGSYSGRLEAWRHYVPLKHDHSNMAEVVAVLRDPARAEAIIERAYQEVALAPRNTFRAMVDTFDAAVSETAAHKPPAAGPYDDAAFAAIAEALAPTNAARARQQVRRNAALRRLERLLAPLPPGLAARINGLVRYAARRSGPLLGAAQARLRRARGG